jgi:hypothetical protein
MPCCVRIWREFQCERRNVVRSGRGMTRLDAILWRMEAAVGPAPALKSLIAKDAPREHAAVGMQCL